MELLVASAIGELDPDFRLQRGEHHRTAAGRRRERGRRRPLTRNTGEPPRELAVTGSRNSSNWEMSEAP